MVEISYVFMSRLNDSYGQWFYGNVNWFKPGVVWLIYPGTARSRSIRYKWWGPGVHSDKHSFILMCILQVAIVDEHVSAQSLAWATRPPRIWQRACVDTSATSRRRGVARSNGGTETSGSDSWCLHKTLEPGRSSQKPRTVPELRPNSSEKIE